MSVFTLHLLCTISVHLRVIPFLSADPGMYLLLVVTTLPFIITSEKTRMDRNYQNE